MASGSNRIQFVAQSGRGVDVSGRLRRPLRERRQLPLPRFPLDSFRIYRDLWHASLT